MHIRTVKEQALRGRDPSDDFCAICFNFLCEPVPWPDCSHHFCLLCSTRLRLIRDNPQCPLCRSPAVRVRRVADLKVDKDLARGLRQRRGAAKYDAQASQIRDEMTRVAAAGGPPPAELHLLCLGVWDFQRGSEHGLQLIEPRDCELAKRVLANPQQRFGIVLAPHIERGARGRVAEIVGHNFLEDGVCVLVVHGGESFVVREILRSAGDRRNSEPVRGHVEMGEVSLRSSGSRAVPLPPPVTTSLRRSQSSPAVSTSAAESSVSSPAHRRSSAATNGSSPSLRRSPDVLHQRRSPQGGLGSFPKEQELYTIAMARRMARIAKHSAIATEVMHREE